MDSQQHEFHFEEYKQLRTEVAGLLNRIEQLFRYSLVVAATVSAWLIANSMGMSSASSHCIKLPPALVILGWAISPVFIACAGYMADTTNKRIRHVGLYLTQLEKRLAENGVGWEQFLCPEKNILTESTERVWWLLFSLSLAAAVIGVITTLTSKLACS